MKVDVLFEQHGDIFLPLFRRSGSPMPNKKYPEKDVCFTGAGQSAVGRPSSRSPLQLTVDACLQAIADAGLAPSDIDGLTTYPGGTPHGGGISPVGATEAMLALGLNPTWVSASIEGHNHMGAIINAILAISAGLCRHVLIFRTVAQASAARLCDMPACSAAARRRDRE